MRGPMNLSKFVALAAVIIALAVAVGLTVVSSTASFSSAVVALTAMVITIAAFYSIEAGLMALIFVACTDGFLKGLSPGWYTQVLKDYLLALCLLRWAWMSVLGHRRESVHQRIVIPLVLFTMWVAMQMFNTTTHSMMLALAGFRAWVIWIPVFFIAYDQIRTREQLERMLTYITLLLVPIALYTVVQYNIGYEHLYRLGPGFKTYAKAGYFTEDYEVETRPSATMISPHNDAAAMSCGILAAAGGILFFRRRRLMLLATTVALPLEGVAMLLTAARAAFTSTAFAALVLLVMVRRTGIALVMALIIVVAVTQVGRLTGGRALDRLTSVITHAQDSINRAYLPWRMAVAYARDHPLGSGVATGHAAGRVIWGELRGKRGVAEPIPWAENEFGRSLIELGIPGLMLYIWMLYSVLKAIFASWRELQMPQYRWLAAGMISACIGVMGRLTVGAALYTWPEAIFFWIFVAACMRLPQMEAEELETAEEPAPAHAAAEPGRLQPAPAPGGGH